jgi:membrane associated rhomboid family serine protease
MSNVTLNIDKKAEYFDVCQRCHFIWFDPQEFESLPQKQHTKPPKKELSSEAKKIIALAKIDSLKQEQEVKKMGVSSPDHWWELILGIFGMPVEYNSAYIRKVPFATYSIAAAIILATGTSFFNLESITMNWGLVPDQFTRHFGLTFISSFLLHGGVIHLLSNLYFLLVFGDNVEDTLGKKYYLFLIGLSALAGDLAHILADPRASTPLIGASGGISGILTYYCLRFPKAKVGILFWFRWFRIPVGVLLLLWFFGQVLGAYKQISGFGNISALAHLGGALVGFIFWLKIKNLPNVGRPSNNMFHSDIPPESGS